jgi:hypothetical protein
LSVMSQVNINVAHHETLPKIAPATDGASHILLSGLNSRKAYINVFCPIITAKAWDAKLPEPGCDLLMAP